MRIQSNDEVVLHDLNHDACFLSIINDVLCYRYISQHWGKRKKRPLKAWSICFCSAILSIDVSNDHGHYESWLRSWRIFSKMFSNENCN